ncbi:MAG: hypothetical protein Q7S39_00640 [Ignavibacteria bacterium]|nr:hypothetical protein [Ignavibacteria bacterium]
MEVLEKSAVKSDLLEKLGINETNYGSSSGLNWNKTTSEGELNCFI